MAEPITLAEAKRQCRMVEDDSEDTYIEECIAPARAIIERRSRYFWVATTRTETFRRWGDYLEIYRRPIASVTSVKYSTSDDPADDISYTGFAADLNSFPFRIYPALGGTGFPTIVAGQTITVIYVSGALDDESEEYIIGKRAMLALIGLWFDNRGEVPIGTITNEFAFVVDNILADITPLSAY